MPSNIAQLKAKSMISPDLHFSLPASGLAESHSIQSVKFHLKSLSFIIFNVWYKLGSYSTTQSKHQVICD